jgi:hypothetical protein
MAQMRQLPCQPDPAFTIYVAAHNRYALNRLSGKKMKSRSALAAIGGFLEVFGSAVAVSRAVDANRQPSARHLRTLGIDPKAFGEIIRR